MVVVFAGTPEFAGPSLRMLAGGPHRIGAVYTRPDRPAGRGRRLAVSPVKAVALELGLPVEQPESLRDPAARERLAAYRPDLVVTAAFGLVLPPDVLALPPSGCINVHASLLPRWRGAAPVQHALLAGDTETGVTIMEMDAGIDTGGILLARACPVRAADTAGSLTDRLARIGADALAEAMAGLAARRIAPRPQGESGATLAPRIRKADALLDWSRDARDLERRVRAFDPWPTAFTFAGEEPLRILRAEAVADPDPGRPAPGTVIRAGAPGIEVQAGAGRLRVLRLQRPGRQPMEAREFLNGCRLEPGERLGERTRPDAASGMSEPDPNAVSARAAARGRDAALAILRDVLHDRRSLTGAAADRLAPVSDPRERALARELASGVVRHLPSLRHVLGTLLERPLRRQEARLETVLLLGLYQILHTRVPPHAAVHETVRLAGKPAWRRGLANAVLRRAASRRDAILGDLERTPDLEARYAHPRWIIDRFRADWPGDWEAILAANGARAPMTLRAGRRAGGRAACLETLRQAGLAASPHPVAPDAIVLHRPLGVENLPGFADGAVSVQDAAAQLAVPLLGLEPGMRVLDACAAPGGKTAQILDAEPRLRELVAVDIDPERLARAGENAARTGGRARLVAGDASAPGEWWDGVPFDRILVDAPCSGSGVIRRHPDVKLHRRAADLDALETRQSALLDAAWDMLAPSGRLVYATCSVLLREGARQTARFLERHHDAEPIESGWGRACGPGRQILPGDADMDGFFHACISRERP